MTVAYLGRAGIHWFDGLPVISYAVFADPSRDTTSTYSLFLSALDELRRRRLV
jgi:hypothetical protein